MGEVYRARVVAIKLLPADASNPDAVERFQREARAVAAINHPNIVTIYGVEEAEGRLFLAMEFVDGETLADAILSHGLPLDRILEYGIPLADALGAAHAQGITHRDLKPSNVMVTKDRRVKVLDFGLAKLRGGAVQIDAATTTRGLTGQGQIIGTVAYMSPEQARGAAIDHRTDLFSFGVILYQMATGQRPFAGDSSVVLLAAILKEQPKPLADQRPDLPREFARIVRRALAKDPEQRYQTAKDLRNDLQTLKDDLTSGELPAIGPAGARRRSVSTWIMAAVGTLALIAVIGGYVLLHGRPPSSESSADTVDISRLTSTGKASLAAISPDGKYVVHVLMDGGSGLWVRQTATGSNVQIAPSGSNRYIGLTFSPDGNYVYCTREEGRTIYSVFRIPTLGGTFQPIIRDVDSAVAISSDGSQIAFIRNQPRVGNTAVLVARSDGTNPVELANRPYGEEFAPYSGIAWSPDGHRLVVPTFRRGPGGRDATIETIDAVSKAERAVTSRHWQTVAGLAWLPSGAIVVSATESGRPNPQLWRVSPDDGQVRRLTNDLNSYQGVSAAVALPSLVTVQGDQSSTVSVSEPGDVGSLKPITAGSGRYDGRFGLTWTPDGKLIYSSASTGQSHLWISEADGSQARQITSTPAIEVSPSVCPDNRTIVVIEEVAGHHGLSRIDITTGRVTALTSDPSDFRPHCLPDGRGLVFNRAAANQIALYRMALDGTDLAPLKPVLFAHAVSPDGRFITGIATLTATSPFVVAVWPIDATEPRRTFDIVSIPTMLTFTPRGDALTFLESRKGPQALWTQPLDSGAPTLLLDLHGETVVAFAWSRDGRLAVAHGPAPTDVVLMSSGRGSSRCSSTMASSPSDVLQTEGASLTASWDQHWDHRRTNDPLEATAVTSVPSIAFQCPSWDHWDHARDQSSVRARPV
jgi:serine/threonine protein kinase